MPGRSYSATSQYRYGFNGKELEKETSSTSTYDYGFRIYNPTLGRFLSVDPLSGSYPWYTPYQFAGNNPIAFIDLDGLEEAYPTIHYNPNNQGGYGSTTLSKSQWLYNDRSSATGTFATAASCNTETLNSLVYKPVDQIHKYYVWAAREIDKQKSNIKFFHAARDVTNFFGVSGAFVMPEIITGLSDHGRKSLADVNSCLLKENMPVIKEILKTGSSSLFNSKKGILWDFEYVNREQTFLTDVINKDPLSESDRKAINSNFEAFEPIHVEYTLAKSLLGVKKIDYLPKKQRMAIGRSLVFMHHMQRNGFEGSAEYNNSLNFLRNEYGKENVDNFLKAYNDNKTKIKLFKKVNDE